MAVVERCSGAAKTMILKCSPLTPKVRLSARVMLCYIVLCIVVRILCFKPTLLSCIPSYLLLSNKIMPMC